MKKDDKFIVKKGGQYYECTVLTYKKEKEKPDIGGAIYNALNTAEIIAVKLAQLNQIYKRYQKTKNRRLKKFGKVDKKTGTLILKGVTKQKAAPKISRRK